MKKRIEKLIKDLESAVNANREWAKEYDDVGSLRVADAQEFIAEELKEILLDKHNCPE